MIEEGHCWKSKEGSSLTVKRLYKDIKLGRWVAEVECSVCSKDKEMFPEIITQTCVIERGCTSCGCNKYYKCDERQHIIRIKRKCKELGYVYEGYQGFFKGNKTKIHLYNPESGNRWSTCTIANFMRGRQDPSLRSDRIVNTRTSSTKEAIKKVVSSYKFYENMFNISYVHKIRENNPDKTDWYVNYSCSNCKFTDVSCSVSNIGKDKVSCGCSSTGGFFPKRVEEVDHLYIALREEDNLVKIGRSFKPKEREVGLNRALEGRWDILYTVTGSHTNTYELEQHILYKFAEDRLFEESDEIFKAGYDMVIKDYLLARGFKLDVFYGEEL